MKKKLLVFICIFLMAFNLSACKLFKSDDWAIDTIDKYVRLIKTNSDNVFTELDIDKETYVEETLLLENTEMIYGNEYNVKLFFNAGKSLQSVQFYKKYSDLEKGADALSNAMKGSRKEFGLPNTHESESCFFDKPDIKKYYEDLSTAVIRENWVLEEGKIYDLVLTVVGEKVKDKLNITLDYKYHPTNEF